MNSHIVSFKKIGAIGACFLLLHVGLAQSQLDGVWNPGVGDLLLEIRENNLGHREGVIVTSDNPDAPPGKQIIRNLTYKEDHWEGEFFIPRFGKWLEAHFYPEAQQMEVTVYVGWFSKSRVWSRHKAPPIDPGP